MSDIRARLADALADHMTTFNSCLCGEDDFTFADDWGRHLADVLLSLHDIAIVDVKSHQNVVPENDLVCYELGGGSSILYSTDDARTIAAALLAAANAAEDADD